MKKRLALLTTAVALAACSGSHRDYDYGEQRAMDYVTDMVIQQGFEVKSTDVVRCDTLITDKYLTDQEFNIRLGRVRVGGDMTAKEYKDFLLGVIRHSYVIEQAWFENSLGRSDTNDSLRHDDRYVFMPVYTVKAETSSKMQPTMTFRIVSDMMGNPQCTDEELLKRVSDFREKVETVYTTVF